MEDQPEHARSPQPQGEQRGVVTDALLQTANDLKQIGIGAAGGYLAAKLAKDSDRPKDK